MILDYVAQTNEINRRHVNILVDIYEKLTGSIYRNDGMTVHIEDMFNIFDSVHKCADQSNLLCLTAAIDTVMAGQVGRRFAVLARELRNF